MSRTVTLQQQLDEMTAPAADALVEVIDAEENKLRCLSCGHRCLIKDGRRGICRFAITKADAACRAATSARCR